MKFGGIWLLARSVDKGLVDVMVVLRPLLTFKTISTGKARKEGNELRK